MTEHEVRELDEQLSECGLTCNARSEFQTVPQADADAEPSRTCRSTAGIVRGAEQREWRTSSR